MSNGGADRVQPEFVMVQQSSLFRRTLVAMLIAGIVLLGGVTPFWAQCSGLGLILAADLPQEIATCVKAPSRAACCCGTEAGDCCGTACCFRPTPNPVSSNPPLRSGLEKREAQAVVVIAKSCGIVGLEGEFAHGWPRQSQVVSATSTLQSQHVRMQT